MGGDFELQNGKPKFNISSHGMLDCGILYAIHIFRDSEDRLLQLGWVDEAANSRVVKQQGWAGCLAHPREIYEVSRSISEAVANQDNWNIDEEAGVMITLGIRLAPQIRGLRNNKRVFSLNTFRNIHSDNFEVYCTFKRPTRKGKFSFKVRQSPRSEEFTKIVFDLKENCITVDRLKSSLENLGTNTSDSGDFFLLPDEDLHVHFFVDNSILEIYANDRFALTSRIYPSLETSLGASYDFGVFDERNVEFECWEGLKDAWPSREEHEIKLMNSENAISEKDGVVIHEGVVAQAAVYA
ncbi:hypothetical protein G7Y89_g9621 [Cudoniella acicularis]|uniref:Glycosyl hydrolase family 32 C-terminal domain-containing protein n=1 Tax=Cudoniella acicularis TaxID=354080 RepID=A0A8H4RFU5_9HELO|nr:hypothetical protein G7Y89_g9621 [Cudoniella acicularis]